MSIAHPIRNAEEYGRVLIGGSRLPGILTEVAVPARKFNWTVQKGFGISMVTAFASVDILTGITFTHFLNLKTTGADDWAALQAYLRVLLPKWPNDVQTKPKSFIVDYPLLQYLGAKRIHLTDFSAPEPPSGEKIPQFYKVTFQEDIPNRKPPVGTAEPAKTNGPPEPKNQYEAALFKLYTDFKVP